MRIQFIWRVIGFFAVVLSVTLSPCNATAEPSNAAGQETVTGLGLATPARPDVSQDQRFRAYIWADTTRPIVQINDTVGRVIAVFIVTADGAKSLGIGEARAVVRDNTNSQPFVLAVNGDQLVKCPCTATKLLDQDTFSVVVVLGSRNEVIAIQAINHSTDS